MRPNGEELLRGLQGTLMTYVLPEVHSEHARLEVMLAVAMLGVLADEWDGAAQRLAENNDALRSLAASAAGALDSHDAGDLVRQLRALAEERDVSLRISDLTETNDRLKDALVRAWALARRNGVALDLAVDIVERLRAQTEARALSLLGPRADG